MNATDCGAVTHLSPRKGRTAKDELILRAQETAKARRLAGSLGEACGQSAGQSRQGQPPTFKNVAESV